MDAMQLINDLIYHFVDVALNCCKVLLISTLFADVMNCSGSTQNGM